MDPPRTLECTHVRQRGASWIRWLAGGWLSVFVFFASWAAATALGGVGLGLLLALSLTSVGQVILSSIADRSRSGGSVRLDSHGRLTVMPRERAPFVVGEGRVHGGYENPTAHAAVLQFEDGSEVILGLRPGDLPEHVLEHVGVGAAQRALTLPLRGAVGAGTLAFIGLTMGGLAAILLADLLRSQSLLALSPIVAFFGAATLALWLGRPRVTIGVDGVTIHGAFGPRFTPFSEVSHIETVGLPGTGNSSGLRIHTTQARVLALPLLGMGAQAVESLKLRIERAAEARSRAEAARRVASLARAGRSIAEWRADVVRVASSEAGFRRAAIGASDLEHLLRDPTAPADERVGAALALRVADPEAANEHIRIAIESAADDSLRSALTGALEDDDLAIDRGTRAARS